MSNLNDGRFAKLQVDAEAIREKIESTTTSIITLAESAEGVIEKDDKSMAIQYLRRIRECCEFLKGFSS